MDLNFPEKKLVASLLEEHQTIAFEIRIDRLDLFAQKLIDVEDIVLWVQVLDLPYMEMLPYQRHKRVSECDSNSNAESNSNQRSDDDNGLVKLSKKSVMLNLDVDIKNSELALDIADEQLRILRNKRKTVYKREKIMSMAQNYLMESKGIARKKHSKGRISHNPVKVASNSQLLNVELDEPKQESKLVQDFVEETDKELIDYSKEGKSKETFTRDDESLRKYRLLSKYFAGKEAKDVPEGATFNSDCCILIPCSSVADTLYKMERMPLIIYVVELNQDCTKLVGKMCLPMDYCFQKAVIKAAKLKAGVVNHALEQPFPIYKTVVDGKGTVKIGNLFGSINLVCYGRFGMTEIKSTTGDLMSKALCEWRTDCRDLSNTIQEEGINIFEQPYGFKPVTTRNTLPPSNRSLCPSLEPPQSMFDFIHKYHDLEDKTHRLKRSI